MPTSTKRLLGALLRLTALLIGALVCLLVLARRGGRLPLVEVALLGSAASLLRLRHVVMRRGGPDNRPILTHVPGDSLILIALLRHGPEGALAVSLLTNVVSTARAWRGWFPGGTLAAASSLFYLPALAYLGGVIYEGLGGQRILAPADCARFFHDPRAVLLPLLSMMVVSSEIVNRLFQGFNLFLGRDVPLRETLADPGISFFDYLEALGGLLTLILWTAWGWSTLPFSALQQEALLLAARSHFERRDARREAASDPLTGAASSRALSENLRRRVSRRARLRPFALLFLDVDNLKQVNDRWGHALGDDLLRLVAEVAARHARPSDLVGRRSGDEFLIVLDAMDRAQAERAAMMLQSAIQQALDAETRFLVARAGVSVGIAVFPDDAREENALIGIADRQMYRNKKYRKSEPK